MELSKNDKIELTIDALTSEGSGVGRYNGLAVFVRGTVPQDKIIAHIIKRSKNYAVGIVDKILSPSPERIESDCPYSKKCGGCSFRHMTYDEELRYKKSRVQEALSRIGHLDIEVDEIIGADELTHYRNKAQYPVDICDGEMLAGFYAYKSHRIIPCADCRLQPAEFENGLSAFAKWIEQENVSSYNEQTGRGLLRHIYFRKGFATNEIMACAVINSDNIPNSDLLINLLKDNVDGLTSVALNINKEKTNVILGSKTKIIWGSENIKDELLGKTFLISPNSFYQVNHNQCEKLYSKAKEFAGLTGSETVLDLYCGVGTIGLTMADSAKQLVGIEIIPQAIENAKENAKINNITNAEFICSDAPKGAEILKNQGIKPDVIILDPPRKGCDKSLFDTIEQLSPSRIVYVSCDSATLARDLAVLNEKGYETKKVSAVDMFPRTPHVEAVALVENRRFLFDIKNKFDFSDNFDSFDKIMNFFREHKDDHLEYSDYSKDLYNVLNWNAQNVFYGYFDIINSFWITFACGLVISCNELGFDYYSFKDNFPNVSRFSKQGYAKRYFEYSVNDNDKENHFMLILKNLKENCPEIQIFSELVHTVSNFTPCPKNFNKAKGLCCEVRDYMPLMIDKIQECINNQSELKYLDGKELKCISLAELLSWKDFFVKNIERLCLFGYYTIDKNGELKGKPLFKNQSLTNTLPKSMEQFRECLINMIKIIQSRNDDLNHFLG